MPAPARNTRANAALRVARRLHGGGGGATTARAAADYLIEEMGMEGALCGDARVWAARGHCLRVAGDEKGAGEAYLRAAVLREEGFGAEDEVERERLGARVWARVGSRAGEAVAKVAKEDEKIEGGVGEGEEPVRNGPLKRLNSLRVAAMSLFGGGGGEERVQAAPVSVNPAATALVGQMNVLNAHGAGLKNAIDADAKILAEDGTVMRDVCAAGVRAQDSSSSEAITFGAPPAGPHGNAEGEASTGPEAPSGTDSEDSPSEDETDAEDGDVGPEGGSAPRRFGDEDGDGGGDSAGDSRSSDSPPEYGPGGNDDFYDGDGNAWVRRDAPRSHEDGGSGSQASPSSARGVAHQLFGAGTPGIGKRHVVATFAYRRRSVVGSRNVQASLARRRKALRKDSSEGNILFNPAEIASAAASSSFVVPPSTLRFSGSTARVGVPKFPRSAIRSLSPPDASRNPFIQAFSSSSSTSSPGPSSATADAVTSANSSPVSLTDSRPASQPRRSAQGSFALPTAGGSHLISASSVTPTSSAGRQISSGSMAVIAATPRTVRDSFDENLRRTLGSMWASPTTPSQSHLQSSAVGNGGASSSSSVSTSPAPLLDANGSYSVVCPNLSGTSTPCPSIDDSEEQESFADSEEDPPDFLSDESSGMGTDDLPSLAMSASDDSEDDDSDSGFDDETASQQHLRILLENDIENNGGMFLSLPALYDSDASDDVENDDMPLLVDSDGGDSDFIADLEDDSYSDDDSESGGCACGFCGVARDNTEGTSEASHIASDVAAADPYAPHDGREFWRFVEPMSEPIAARADASVPSALSTRGSSSLPELEHYPAVGEVGDDEYTHMSGHVRQFSRISRNARGTNRRDMDVGPGLVSYAAMSNAGHSNGNIQSRSAGRGSTNNATRFRPPVEPTDERRDSNRRFRRRASAAASRSEGNGSILHGHNHGHHEHEHGQHAHVHVTGLDGESHTVPFPEGDQVLNMLFSVLNDNGRPDSVVGRAIGGGGGAGEIPVALEMALGGLNNLPSLTPEDIEADIAPMGVGLQKEFIDLIAPSHPLPEDCDGSVGCIICTEDLRENTVRMMPCNGKHFFHSQCIDEWLSAHATCPTCRTDFSEMETPLHAAPVPSATTHS